MGFHYHSTSIPLPFDTIPLPFNYHSISIQFPFNFHCHFHCNFHFHYHSFFLSSPLEFIRAQYIPVESAPLFGPVAICSGPFRSHLVASALYSGSSVTTRTRLLLPGTQLGELCCFIRKQ